MQATSQVMADKKKLMKVDPDVHKALGEVGQWGETYSDIIRRLIKEHKERTQKK
jgi:predicted CopG family antitoxin